MDPKTPLRNAISYPYSIDQLKTWDEGPRFDNVSPAMFHKVLRLAIDLDRALGIAEEGRSAANAELNKLIGMIEKRS